MQRLQKDAAGTKSVVAFTYEIYTIPSHNNWVLGVTLTECTCAPNNLLWSSLMLINLEFPPPLKTKKDALLPCSPH